MITRHLPFATFLSSLVLRPLVWGCIQSYDSPLCLNQKVVFGRKALLPPLHICSVEMGPTYISRFLLSFFKKVIFSKLAVLSLILSQGEEFIAFIFFKNLKLIKWGEFNHFGALLAVCLFIKIVAICSVQVSNSSCSLPCCI